MDDGVTLHVDIVHPADPATGERLPGPFPVLLNQDMYAGGAAASLSPPDSYGDYFVRRGYIYVHVHDRGTGGSEGAFDPGFGDRVGLDGVELAYWAADPDNVLGSNGRVGLHGCSALGVVQLSTLATLGSLLEAGEHVYVPGSSSDAPGSLVPATHRTNPIAAAFPSCVGVSVFHEQYTDNGVPSFINALALAQPVAQPALIGYNLHDPSSNFTQSMSSLDMLAGGDTGYHRDHWKERDFVHRAPQIARTGVPVITWVGWQEGGSIGTLPLYAALQNVAAGRNPLDPMLPACETRQGGPSRCQRISPAYQALVGDWGHGGGLDPGIELQWFDTWVRGQDTGLEVADEPIHLQERSSAESGRWVNATSYPMTQDYTAFHLDVGGELRAGGPTELGMEQLVWPAGPTRSYTVADAVDEDQTVLGQPAVRLWLRSSNTNAHLFLELVDVAPDGTATPITHGSILASRRTTDSFRTWSSNDGLPIKPHLTLEHDDYLEPDSIVRLDVPLQPTSWRLRAGHRIQLRVATNAGQKCSPTGLFAPPVGCVFSAPTARSLVGGVYDVLHGPDYPSLVSLPLVRSADIETVSSGPTPTSGGVHVPNDWGSGGRRPR